METREGYKKTKIGWIPEDWNVSKACNAVDILLSNVDKKSNKNEEKVLLCNYMDVYNNDYISPSINFMIATAKEREIEKFELKQDDVIITKDSETKEDIAQSAVVTENLEKVLCGYHLAILRPLNGRLNGRFLMNALKNTTIHKYFIKLANGTTRFGLTNSAIGQALLPIPPLPEQQKIASILSTVDKKIESIEEQIKKTEQLKKGLMNKLLTEGIGHTEFKDTKIGRIPKSWEVKKLDEATGIVDYRGKTPQKSEHGIFLVTAKNIKKGKIDYSLSQEFIPCENYNDVMRRGLPLKGDVIITTEAPLGEIASIDREDVALAQRVIKLRGESNILNNTFLKYYLMSDSFQYRLNLEATGTTVKGIKGSRLKKIQISVPNLSEQIQIVSVLNVIFEKNELQQQKKSNYETLKKGLMQQLLTGQMRVKI